MQITQVYNTVNTVAKQMYGDSAVEVTDVQGLISLGNDVLSSQTSKDNFLDTLVDLIGRTIISQRAYSAQVNDLINDAFTFGAILQKLYVAPIAASKSGQWDLANGGTVDQYVIAKPTVKQKLFSKRDTWEVDITIPDIQLTSAFRSAEEMAAFIDAIFTAMRNSQEVYMAGMAELCWGNMIAEQVIHTELNGGATAVDLLGAYNTLMNTNLTTAQAMVSLDFLKYASMTINLFTKKMEKMATIFNAEKYARFTQKDRLRVYMLADFTTACASYLQANTYHDELVALPKYRELPYWQGLGQNTNFDSTGTVSLITTDGYTVLQQHVIAVLCDEEAIGLTYDNRRSKSAYNSKGEYTNFFEKADIGYFNDLSENCVVFTVGKLTVPTQSSVAPLQNTYSKTAGADVEVTLSLMNSETVKAVSVNGTALTSATDYTATSTALTIKSSYLTKQTGTIAIDVELNTNAIMEFYVTITD